MDLINEIKRRQNDDSDIYQALGAEIKQHRIKQSKTLSKMACNTFSISYLCKIEKNQVRPSKKYLKEICDKINISDDKVNTLLNSRDILLDIIKHFYYNDVKAQNDILFNFEGLDNHRVILMRFICAITRLDIIECSSYIDKLWDLTSSLANLDLILFTTFFGIYKFYMGQYIEAMDYIKTALEFNINVDYLKPIQYGYLFAASVKTYSPNTIMYYYRLEELQLKYGRSMNIETANYNMCLYYLMLKQFDNFRKTVRKLENKNSIYSLNVIYDLILNKDVVVTESKLDKLSKLYYYVHIGSLDAIKMIENADIFMLDKLLLQYLYYKERDVVKSFDFILDDLLPYINKHSINYIGYLLLNELLNSPVKVSKYKSICDIFVNLYSISMEVI